MFSPFQQIAMPTGISSSKTTTLTHIIDDPIIRLYLVWFCGVKAIRKSRSSRLVPGL
jgi:hypothetical protein